MDSWEDIKDWRRSMRAELRAKRHALPSGEKASARRKVSNLMWHSFPELRDARIGFYWPFQGEIDLRPLIQRFLIIGARGALPVVVEKGKPVCTENLIRICLA
jgi:5-formyltetrahydrofolate cyclo-ligase